MSWRRRADAGIGLVIRTSWVAVAGATLLVASRAWWPLHQAAEVAAGDRRVGPATRRVAALQARVVGGLALVAGCNLAAGLYSLATPQRPDAYLPPKSRVDWIVFVVPAALMAAAVTKLVLVVEVARAWREVAGSPPRQRDGALD